ncbi:hypothetical protein Tco_1058237 [Tanacetum coccineum]|uniref:Uncharacterized protein n=1 Tax=Tanacetum coccineum TaxID=301880 RepID=A0ABQ5H978_9ASTR
MISIDVVNRRREADVEDDESLFHHKCFDIDGLSTAAPQGGRMGGWSSRGGGRTKEPTSKVGGQTGDQGDQGGQGSD